MKEVKDDFSDLYEELYAEVEVQASSAINCLPSIDKKNIPDIVGSTVDGKNDVTDDTGSDSEDDLNIVLNNNPTNVDQFPVSDCEDDLNIVLPSATNSNQTGHNFLLPRRSSSVDIHESKPWRNPGVDITDFFNFGFNEDKWKRYCKDLQQKGRAIHLKDSSSNECRELKKRPIDQDQNVIEIVAPDSRKDSKYLDAENISVLKGSELYTNYSAKRFSKHQGFKTDQNQNRCVDENEYISKIEFSVEKENERRGRWKREEEEEEEEESHFRRSMKDYSFVREHRRRFDFKDEKYRRCFPYNSRSRENWENYGRGRFRYHERSKRRYSSPPIHLHNFVNRSWSSRYASKRRLHCTSPPRYRVNEKHDRHEQYQNQIRSKRFNGKGGYHGRFGTIHEEQHVVQCRCKLTREENRSNRFDRSCNFIRRGNREQTQRNSDNLVDCDIAVPEEKSAKRCSNGGRRMHEKVEWKVGLDSKALSDFNEPPMDKVLATEKLKIKENEKREEWIDKIPVMEQKEALDVEEGQIITEETSESSIDDYISSWFRDPMSVDEQSAGLGTTSDLWMI